ncbi:MAG: hypothetical protein KU37_09340 [Sulfuricurvum sp. PC08-66]|nr:MAG: hypothetical protein KU37_09340 [Sulfuricurvum sp. PC08-66]
MQRINLTIDEALYEEARTISFLEKKPISQIVRESLALYLASSPYKQHSKLILEADDKAEVLNILKNEPFETLENFKQKFDL